jgi:hypothetical protein
MTSSTAATRRQPIQDPPRPLIGRGRAARLALAFCLLLAIAHALFYWPEVIDDAYIVFRYARNYVLGYGIAFNPGGPQVEGCSTLTWFWLSVLGLRLGIHDLLTWVKLAGLLLHAATVFGVWRLGLWATRSIAAAILAALLYALNPFAAYHAVTGLETPLVTALIVATVVAVAGLRSRPGIALAGLTLGLPMLLATRPESFGYAGGILLAGWVLHREDPAIRRRVVIAAVVAVAAMALLLGWRWMTFGALFPNSAAAKVGGMFAWKKLAGGLVYTVRYFSALRIPSDVVLYLVCGFALLLRPLRRNALVAAPVVCAAVFSTAVGGDWMHSFRFMVPAAPFISVLVAAGVQSVFEPRGWSPGTAAVVRAGTMMALVLTALQLGLIGEVVVSAGHFGRHQKPRLWPAQLAERLTRGYDARLPGVTRWLLEHVSARNSVASDDVGFPAWTGDQRVIDLVGLTDRELARIVPMRNQPAFTRYLEQASPDVVILRARGGKPADVYDRMVGRSGVLSRYAAVDSVATYDVGTFAVMYVRRGVTLDTRPGEVLARYDRALRWSPRVTELRRWRDAYRHTQAR